MDRVPRGAADDLDREVLDLFASFLAKEVAIDRVRAATTGFDAPLWQQLAAMGVPALGLDEAVGLRALVGLAEECGRVLAPVPLVEALVAARLIGRFTTCPSEVAEGERLATVAVTPSSSGIARGVPAGAVAPLVVALDGDELVLAGDESNESAPVLRTLAPLAAGDRDLSIARIVLAAGAEARNAYDAAIDEWRLLTAAALVGVAEEGLRLGVEYARTRVQFGAPIGSYQAVQQRLADIAVTIEGARLLVEDCVAASERHFAVLAAMALRSASEAAEAATTASLHFHGGYGFMEEYDIQLYLRRAKALPLLLGDPEKEWQRLAARLAEVGWLVDEREISPWRQYVRSFLQAHLPPDAVARAHETGTMHNWEIHRALAEARLIAPTWPEADGGRGCDAFAMAELLEEVAAAEVPQDGWMTTLLVAETLRQCGTPEQREKVIGEVLRGDVLIALGYSEPEVGSDIASVQTRAERDGAGWIINGQKMFTTLAHESSYVLLLTRTDPDAAKHRGLTVFLVPLDTAGIGIAAIRTLGGERTNITYYDDVHVSDKWRVGEVNEGWRVLQVALAFERVPVAQGELFRLYRRMVGWTTATEHLGGSLLEQPSVRQRMARMAVDQRMGALLAQRMTAVGARGELPIVEGSMAKLFTSEAFARHASVSMDIVGAASLLEHGQPGAAVNGSIEHAFRHSQGMTIYAGTSEIQRSIIAERGLGLPRAR